MTVMDMQVAIAYNISAIESVLTSLKEQQTGTLIHEIYQTYFQN